MEGTTYCGTDCHDLQLMIRMFCNNDRSQITKLIYTTVQRSLSPGQHRIQSKVMLKSPLRMYFQELQIMLLFPSSK